MSCVPSTVYFWLYSEDCDMWRKWSGFFPSLIYKRWDGCCNIYLSECGSSRSFSLSCRCAKEIICWDSAAAAAKEEEEIEPHSLNVIVMREIRQPKKQKKNKHIKQSNSISFFFCFFCFLPTETIKVLYYYTPADACDWINRRLCVKQRDSIAIDIWAWLLYLLAHISIHSLN